LADYSFDPQFFIQKSANYGEGLAIFKLLKGEQAVSAFTMTIMAIILMVLKPKLVGRSFKKGGYERL